MTAGKDEGSEQNSSSLPPEIEVALNRYLAKIAVGIGILNVLALIFGAAYLFVVMPERAANVALEKISLTDDRFAKTFEQLIRRTERVRILGDRLKNDLEEQRAQLEISSDRLSEIKKSTIELSKLITELTPKKLQKIDDTIKALGESEKLDGLIAQIANIQKSEIEPLKKRISKIDVRKFRLLQESIDKLRVSIESNDKNLIANILENGVIRLKVYDNKEPIKGMECVSLKSGSKPKRKLCIERPKNIWK